MNILFPKLIFRLDQVKRVLMSRYLMNKMAVECEDVGLGINVEYPANLIGLKNMVIGNNFIARKGLKLRAFERFHEQNFTPRIKIGDNVQIESNCHIGCINCIEIGDGVLIASFVTVLDHVHGNESFLDIDLSPIKRKLSSKGPIKIEKNVWIGEKVTILAGVTIGEGAIIGANSTVTNDIAAYSIAVGSPARVIKKIGLS